MSKYRIVEQFYRGENQEIKSSFIIQEMRHRIVFFKEKEYWETLEERYLGFRSYYYAPIIFSKKTAALKYLKNLTTPLPQDRVIKQI